MMGCMMGCMLDHEHEPTLPTRDVGGGGCDIHLAAASL